MTADFEVWIAWDDPHGPSRTWVEITDRVLGFTTSTGRKGREGIEVGGATLTLDNSDRHFDPLYTAGPYYGDLSPARAVRVSCHPEGVGHGVEHLWIGYVDGWPQDYSGQIQTELVVSCTDLLRWVLPATAPESVWALEVRRDAPWLWWRMTEETGTTVEDWSGNGRTGVLQAHDQHFEALDMGGVARRPTRVMGDRHSTMIGPGSTTPPNVPGLVIRQQQSEPAPPLTLGQYAVELWAYTQSASAGTGTNAFLVACGPVGLLAGADSGTNPYRLYFVQASTANVANTTANVVQQGRVSHIIMSKRLVSGTVRTTFFVDGQPIARTETITGVETPDIWRWLALAQMSTVGSDFLEQAIGEVAVHAKPLEEADVLRHYQAAVAPWVGDLTGQRIGRILALAADLIPTHAALDLDPGVTVLGPAILQQATLRELLERTVDAEQGALWVDPSSGTDTLRFRDRTTLTSAPRSATVQWTLSDSGLSGTVAYETLDLEFDTADVVNDVTVRYVGGEARHIDQASIDIHGRLPLSLDVEVAGHTQAVGLAEWIVGRSSTQRLRCRKAVIAPHRHAGDDVAVMAAGVRIGDRVLVEKTPRTTPAEQLTVEVLVEGIEHTFDSNSRDWVTTLHLSSAEAGPWLVWDAGVWDEAQWIW